VEVPLRGKSSRAGYRHLADNYRAPSDARVLKEVGYLLVAALWFVLEKEVAYALAPTAPTTRAPSRGPPTSGSPTTTTALPSTRAA
jgi:hypothetical protein